MENNKSKVGSSVLVGNCPQHCLVGLPCCQVVSDTRMITIALAAVETFLSSRLPRPSPFSHLASNTSEISSALFHELGSLLQSLARWGRSSSNPPASLLLWGTVEARISCFPSSPPLPHLASDTGKISTALLHELSSLLQSATTWRRSTSTHPVGLLLWNIVGQRGKSKVDQKQQDQVGSEHCLHVELNGTEAETKHLYIPLSHLFWSNHPSLMERRKYFFRPRHKKSYDSHKTFCHSCKQSIVQLLYKDQVCYSQYSSTFYFLIIFTLVS